MNETFEKVRAMLVTEFQLDPGMIRPDTQLAELGVDSLAALEFVFVLEDALHISVDATDFRGGKVKDVADAVDQALSQQPALAAAT